MNSIYGTPLTGLHGADFDLDVAANNIANLNTGGYEEVEPVVESLPSQDPITATPDASGAAPATRVGMGVRPGATERSQVQAPLVPTGNPLDFAIDGPGFFAVRQPGSQVAYTQQLSLHVAPDGTLATADGLTTAPPVRVPANVTRVIVDDQDTLRGETRTGATIALGKLPVVTFPAPGELRAQGGGLYTATLGSGRPRAAGAQTGGPQTRVLSGYQLGSTVDLTREMTDVVQAQRTYEINAKALQTLDALVNTIVTLQPR